MSLIKNKETCLKFRNFFPVRMKLEYRKLCLYYRVKYGKARETVGKVTV